MTIGFKFFGLSVVTAIGGDGYSRWLCLTFWYRVAPKRLKYLYGSLPLNLDALSLRIGWGWEADE